MKADRSKITAAAVVAGLTLLAASPAAARKNNPNIRLDFRPQQTVAGAEAVIQGAMLEVPVSMRLEDGRKQDDPALIGTRTDDRDRQFKLRAVGDDAVMKYVDRVLRESTGDWGVETVDRAPSELKVKLLVFRILETNQVVGATYNAEVRLAYSIGPRQGKPRWSGSTEGDATRYGRKFSEANVNEVLSDALLEAIANMLSDSALQDAWDG